MFAFWWCRPGRRRIPCLTVRFKGPAALHQQTCRVLAGDPVSASSVREFPGPLNAPAPLRKISFERFIGDCASPATIDCRAFSRSITSEPAPVIQPDSPRLQLKSGDRRIGHDHRIARGNPGCASRCAPRSISRIVDSLSPAYANRPGTTMTSTSRLTRARLHISPARSQTRINPQRRHSPATTRPGRNKAPCGWPATRCASAPARAFRLKARVPGQHANQRIHEWMSYL
jgi:hypothetical protein